MLKNSGSHRESVFEERLCDDSTKVTRNMKYHTIIYIDMLIQVIIKHCVFNYGLFLASTGFYWKTAPSPQRLRTLV